jgi:hypothetical protein
MGTASASDIAGYYRIGLIEGVVLLLLLLLAFGAITILARDRWVRLGVTESLLARLGASVVLASIAVGGLSGVLLNLLEGAALSDSSLTPASSRNQAVLGIGMAIAVTIVGMIRIEMYHRSVINPRVEADADWTLESREASDWKVEPPEVAGR